MGLNKNIVLVMVAVAMTFAMWIMPEHISAETQQKRLLVLTDYANAGIPRLAGVGKFCQGVTRADLINTEEKATAESYKNAIASAFNVEANKFMNDALNGDAATEAMKISTPFGIYVGFFALGFLVILIQWMCLCCCCCCPSCCPSKCCQKDENEQYTKCELYWPSIFLVLLLLLIIIVSAMGISKAGTFKEGLGDIQCSLSMMLDDVVNGNITTTGAFFIGVDPLITQINALNSSIGTVQTQMNNLQTTLNSMNGKFTTMATNVANVPDGAGNAAVINYNGKIGDAAPTAGPISSKFVEVLGSSANSASIIGILYTALTSTSTTLDAIKTGASGFTGGIGGFQSQVSTITDSLGKVKTQITDLDSSLGSSLDLLETPKSMGGMVISIIYGVMLGLSALALLGVVLMTFCDKYKCRYLMYFSCVILFFLGILGFLLAMIFSFIVPILYFLCGWLDVTLQASTFSGNTQKFLTDTQVRDIVGTCLVGGTGDIIAVVGGASVGTTINGLKDSVAKTNSFDTSASLTTITSNLNQITATLVDFQFGRIIDIADSDAIQTLVSLGAPSAAGCTPLANDGYIPSAQTFTTTFPLPFTPQQIPCSAGSVVNTTTCTQANFEASSTICKGCIDVGDIFNNWYNSAAPNGTATLATGAAWKAKLDARYASADPCVAAFSTLFGNVWTNYYKIKIDAYSPILGRWKSVSDGGNAASDIAQITGAFTNINSTMTGVIGVLQGSVDTITNPKFGMIAGLNCLIIGEDLSLVVGSICISNFNVLYITRLLMGIAAFGILFSMCCIVCSGVRHFKHSERKDRVSPNFMGGDKNNFEQTDAAFRP